MANRIDIPFTNEHFAAWVQKMVGQPYWYGTCLYKAADSLLSRKARQYPSHYSSGRMGRYRKDIAGRKVCADCVGGCKGYAWTNGGQTVLDAIGTDRAIVSKYGSNGCPDKSANGMFAYAKSKGMEWGAIRTLPEIVGLALRCDGHIGYYIGGGYAVEWRGFNYGCVRTKVFSRSWTHWYKLPFIDYGDTDGIKKACEANTVYALGDRLLKKGCAGEDVRTLQELLNQLGSSLEIDGEYGDRTKASVIALQKKHQLEQDGEYGNLTHAALMSDVADLDEGLKDKDPEEEQPAINEKKIIITCRSGTVNIRTGNGTGFDRITAVASGTQLPYIASAANGWHAVLTGGQVGWVSGNYSEITTE